MAEHEFHYNSSQNGLSDSPWEVWMVASGRLYKHIASYVDHRVADRVAELLNDSRDWETSEEM